MRDAAIALFEHLGPHVFIDEVVRVNGMRRGQRQDHGNEETGRGPDAFWHHVHAIERHQAQSRPTPTTPSQSVMARVPIVGIRKNVVPSVPTIEPAVDAP